MENEVSLLSTLVAYVALLLFCLGCFLGLLFMVHTISNTTDKKRFWKPIKNKENETIN